MGHSEQPGTWVWGAHLTSGDTADAVVVANSNKVSVNDVESSGSQAGHVLPQDPFRSQSVDDVEHGWPQPAFVVGSQPFACDADRLAGESAGDEVNGGT
ncbi:hypothetical protein GCM10027200_82440 [Lentzea nigeriaca]